MKPTLIGIAGGTGSGKSTVAEALKNKFGDNLTIIHYDDYYKTVTSDQNADDVNFDHPDQLNRHRLYEDMLKLSKGESIDKPIYDFVTHTSTKTEVVNPAQIILVDGIFSLYDDNLNSLYSMKIFVDMDADLRILRRAQRDIEERGRDIQSVITQYIKTVKNSHYQFVAPQKWIADVVIPNNQERVTPKIDELKILIENKLK